MKKLILLLICSSFIFTQDVQATHMVGGELRYQCLGGNLYRIYLTVRRDCFNGAADAQFDDPAFITAYEPNGGVIDELGQNGVFAVPIRMDDTLNEILTSTCKVLGPDVCVHTTTYFFDVDLRFRPGGYMFVYQRCCLNNTLVNIEDPLETGLTISVILTEEALRVCNSSPVHIQWPSIYLCKDDTVDFDHRALDRNGDSLVYELCTPFEGADNMTSKPTRASAPPYSEVTWKSPYDLSNLLGGDPLMVDRNTGRISGLPNTEGQYLVGTCLYEYRNGILLSVSRRVFEYNVRVCPERPIADFITDNVVCDGFDADFFNNSSGQQFLWYFDYVNDRTITSIDPNPTHTYPAPGIYTVGLIAIRDSTCEDSTFQQVIIYGDEDYAALFDFEIDECEEEVVLLLEDQSYDSLFSVGSISWRIESSDTIITTTSPNLRILYEKSDTIIVQLIMTTEFGCTDTLTKVIPVNILKINFLDDVIPICNGDSTLLVANPNSDFDYEWSPGTGLSCNDCPDPIAFPSASGRYYVTITDGLCSVIDSVDIEVNADLNLVVTGDTIACQRQVDLTTNGGEPGLTIWSTEANFATLIAQGSRTISVNVDSTLTVYVMSATASGCEGLDSITIINEEVFFEALDSVKYCEGDTFTLNVTNLIPDHNLNIIWSPDANLISGQGSANPVFSFQNSGKFTIDFVATNQHDCSKMGSINIDIIDLPKIDFEVEQSCEDLVVNFINQSEMGNYLWLFGDGNSSSDANPSHTYASPGKYVIKLSVEGFCYDELIDSIEVGIIEVELMDTIISCAGEPVNINPNPDLNYTYLWSPKEFLDDETSPNPVATVISSTNFRVTITDPNLEDCYIEREVFVLVTDPIEFFTVRDTLLCYNDTVTLTAIGDYEYCWINENGDTIARNTNIVTVIVPDEEIFTVVGKDEFDCVEEQTIRVKRFNLDVEIEQPDTICFSDAIELKVTNLGEGTLTYSWEPKAFIIEGGDTDNPLVAPDVTTTFTVTITNEFGCVYTRTVEVAVDRVSPRPTITSEHDTVFQTMGTQLNVVPDTYDTYEWLPEAGLSCTDCPDPLAAPDSTTTYVVYVTNARGCLDSAFVRIVVIRPNCNDEDIYVPNVFSPNGDNINDVWYVRSNFVTELEVYVYNRWGEKVFESVDQSIGWDGVYEGEFLRPDVYGYYMRVVCVGGSEFIKQGNLTIVK